MRKKVHYITRKQYIIPRKKFYFSNDNNEKKKKDFYSLRTVKYFI